MTGTKQNSTTIRSILRLPDVLARIGMKRSWFLNEVAKQRAPKPIKIGRASGWDSHAIDAYIQDLIAGRASEAVTND